MQEQFAMTSLCLHRENNIKTKSCLRDEQFVNVGQCYAYTLHDHVMMRPARPLVEQNSLHIRIL